MQEQKKERIKTWMAACMVIVALCVDGLQWLLFFIGPIISIGAYFAFWIWFKILGVSFVGSPKKFGTMGVTALTETVFGFLPVFTLGILAVVLMTMAEDKGGMLGKAAGLAQGKLKP